MFCLVAIVDAVLVTHGRPLTKIHWPMKWQWLDWRGLRRCRQWSHHRNALTCRVSSVLACISNQLEIDFCEQAVICPGGPTPRIVYLCYWNWLKKFALNQHKVWEQTNLRHQVTSILNIEAQQCITFFGPCCGSGYYHLIDQPCDVFFNTCSKCSAELHVHCKWRELCARSLAFRFLRVANANLEAFPCTRSE